jgi:hypothetical protein
VGRGEGKNLTEGFARVIYTIPDVTPTESVEIIGRTEGLTLQSANEWREAVSLAPLPHEQSVGLFHLDDEYQLLAYAESAGINPEHTAHTLIRFPRPVLRTWRGNLLPLFSQLKPYPALNGDLPPLVPALPQAWTLASRETALQSAIDQLGSISLILDLLNAAIQTERLLIFGYNRPFDERLMLIQGLMALLPSCARSDMTFSTHITPPNGRAISGRVVFSSERGNPVRHVFDWEKRQFETELPERNMYVEEIASAWDGKIQTVLKTVDEFEPLVDCSKPGDLIPILPEIALRYQLHARAMHTPESVTPEALKSSLEDGEVLPAEWRNQYASLLLKHALETKDTDAVSLIAGAMDADAALDTNLNRQLSDSLNDTPDLVYVFMRQRLSEGSTPQWQERLHEAATRSLSVAIDSGDTELILSWLRLVAREPDSFELADVLKDGIEKTLPIAYENSDFALNLLVLVSKLATNQIDTLLDDQNLLGALPAKIRDAFALYERDALAELQSHGTSLFLVGMGRAARARNGSAFEAGVLERIWALSNGEKKYNAKSTYTPRDILENTVSTGASWLPSTAIETLLGLLLADRDNALYTTFTTHLAENNLLVKHLPGAMVRSSRSVNNALDIITMLISANKLTPDGALSVYITLLDAWEWKEDTQPLIDAAARILNQNGQIELDSNHLETMLERAATHRSEAPTRTAALALLNRATSLDEDDAFVERLKYVFSHLAWSNQARTAALQWWREFIQGQPTARLSRLDMALEGGRVIEDAQQTLRSVAAMRRLLGKHDIESFTAAIDTAYELLETLAESFEPSERGNDIHFDPETVRATLTEMSTDLKPHQRQILSNSLKELAGLISRMGDNRTKAGLARRGDSVDRQLQTGEQMPGGAVDAMKWMAGFFSGAQDTEEDDTNGVS